MSGVNGNDTENAEAAFNIAVISRGDSARNYRTDQPGPYGLDNCQVDPGSCCLGAFGNSLEDVVVQEVES